MNEKMKVDPFSKTNEPTLERIELEDGRNNYPRIGARCLFVLKNGFMAYGYRYAETEVYLPLDRKRLSTRVVDFWKYVPGPDFWNGSGRALGVGK